MTVTVTATPSSPQYADTSLTITATVAAGTAPQQCKGSATADQTAAPNHPAIRPSRSLPCCFSCIRVNLSYAVGTMKYRLFVPLLLLLLTASCASISTLPTVERSAPSVPARQPEGTLSAPGLTGPTVPALRSLAQAHGRYIGAAVAPGPLLSEPLYAETLAREFNMLTPENALKFGRTRPSRERYTFQDADAIVAFAQANRMAVRGHTLVWHEVLPRWLTAGGFTRDELLAILHEHITTVVGRYRGRIVAWDVVNEALGNDGAWRNTFWYKTIGPEYVDLAFRWAREADPQARLFYNDYGGEGLGRKSDAVYALVQGMMQRGVPIDGVGLQMHVRSDASPEPAEFAASLQRLAGLGLEVHITEMDVRIKGRVTEEELARQASICKDMLRVCFTAENCRAFVFWGFTDRHSWIPKYFPGWGAALPFDEAYRAKPAYRALMEALSTP